MATPFNWQKFVEDNRDKLNILDETSFWQFWRFFFCGDENERENWRRNDRYFDRHVEELRRIIILARKNE